VEKELEIAGQWCTYQIQLMVLASGVGVEWIVVGIDGAVANMQW